jgi:predicted ATPase/DNA-binding SARP family transcriptional activator
MGNGPPAAITTPSVRVDMLGPLRLTVGGTISEVPGPKRRALLALLSTASGRVVAVDDLVDALWPGELPDPAQATLRSHVSRLRRHLGGGAARLEASNGGYCLDLGGEGSGTDVGRARSLLSRARQSDPPVAFGLLAEGRSLWRGRPLVEFGDVDRLRDVAVRLDDLRRSLDESYAAAAIESGHTAEAVEVATALADEHPLSEAAALLVMRAFDGAGRAPEALRVAYGHRRRLRETAGLEPSHELAELERSIAGRSTTIASRVPRPDDLLRGRDDELVVLRAVLASGRLVTITGPAGVGKTRLAVELACTVEGAVALWLDPSTRPDDVGGALARALGLADRSGDPLAACAAWLGSGPRLLVIDGCEHVVDGVRTVVATLLRACPDLTVIATSREPLRIDSEHRVRLGPLPVVGDAETSGHLDDVPTAVALFVDRARRARPGFAPTADDLVVIEHIVSRLDGLPYPIALAASRLSALDLSDLCEVCGRDDRCLDVLAEGTALTLRRTMAWSYDLLSEGQQRVFRWLSVFPEGFDLADVERVVARADPSEDGAAVLAQLVDSSMIDLVPGRPARYRMLGTVRAYASDRLVAANEVGAASELASGRARQVASEPP